MKEYVLGFAFSRGQTDLLLIWKNRPEWQAGRLNGIGGKIEKNETPLQAMIREFKEETMLDVLDWRHYATMEFHDSKVFVFSSMSCSSDELIRAEKEQLTDEKLQLVRVKSFRQGPSIVMTNLQWLVPMAFDTGFKTHLTINYNEDSSR